MKFCGQMPQRTLPISHCPVSANLKSTSWPTSNRPTVLRSDSHPPNFCLIPSANGGGTNAVWSLLCADFGRARCRNAKPNESKLRASNLERPHTSTSVSVLFQVLGLSARSLSSFFMRSCLSGLSGTYVARYLRRVDEQIII